MDKREILGRVRKVVGPLRGSMFEGVEGINSGDPPHTKLVYICHPLSGDIPGNIAAVKMICDAIVKQEVLKPADAQTLRKVIPLAPHLLFPTFMDDEAVE